MSSLNREGQEPIYCNPKRFNALLVHELTWVVVPWAGPPVGCCVTWAGLMLLALAWLGARLASQSVRVCQGALIM